MSPLGLWLLGLQLVLAATALGRQLDAAAPRTEAQAKCCERLQAIGFNSTLPVVVLETGGKSVKYKQSTSVQLCTCSSGRVAPAASTGPS